MTDTLTEKTVVASSTLYAAPRFSDEFLAGKLVHLGDLSEELAHELLTAAANRKERFFELGVAQKKFTEEAVLRARAEQLGLSYMDNIDPDSIADDLVFGLPINFAKQYRLLPISKEDDCVTVAINDPTVSSALDELSMILNARLDLVLAQSEMIVQAINKVYDRGSAAAAAAMEEMEDDDLDAFGQDFEEAVDLLDAEDEAPIIRFVNSVISQAVKENASDIHIEPAEKELIVRFRIDGILYEKIRPPKKLQAAIISRLKIQADLNIAEKRLPQDGRIRLKIAGKDIDFRVATAPTAFGERVTMRLLDRSSVLHDLEDLGFAPRNHKNMHSLIEKSHGIILVTGPTGSGKTTSLYACLSKINRPDLNILTVEDPVEYQLPGISQTQVQAKIDLTFAAGLRSFLRHDPDVIMVGEIRDLETAQIAIQAALTGHLVLSTLHTNDAPGAYTRLIDMGVEPFLVASSVVGVLAQRLVRTICKECKEAYPPEDEELEKLGLDRDTIGHDTPLFRGRGCPTCLDTGYQGRMGIHELLMPEDEVRALIMQHMDSNSIKKEARKLGMSTLRDDGAQKCLAGITTSSEVLRVTGDD